MRGKNRGVAEGKWSQPTPKLRLSPLFEQEIREKPTHRQAQLKELSTVAWLAEGEDAIDSEYDFDNDGFGIKRISSALHSREEKSVSLILDPASIQKFDAVICHTFSGRTMTSKS